MTRTAIERAMQANVAWLDRQWVMPLARLHSGAPPHFFPTCFAVIAAECCGSLKFIPAVNRRQIAEGLVGFQCEEDGLFDPGGLNRSDLQSHSTSYLRMQATYFAIHALDALGEVIPHRIRFIEKLLDNRYLRGWLDGGPWDNPWLHSNNIMFVLTFLETDYRLWGDNAAIQGFDEILLYLDERQDPYTGLWQPDDGRDMENAVYAAYHFFPYYFWRGRRPSYVEQIIDSTLSIQKSDGLFGPNSGGGACEDLDAVAILVMMSLVSDHRARDVKEALRKCLRRLLNIQNDDGGFPNSVWDVTKKSRKRRIGEHVIGERGVDRLFGTPTWYYSGWLVLECPMGKSDMWSAWFRPLVIRMIMERYPEQFGDPLPGCHRRLPGLGWHDASAITQSGVPGSETVFRLS